MDKAPEPDMRKMLEEDLALAKDNHRMLRAIRRGQWFGWITKILFWGILLLLPLYLYQQYLEPLVSRFYPGAIPVSTTSPGFGLPAFPDLPKLLESFKPK
jgi:hypothetical protein